MTRQIEGRATGGERADPHHRTDRKIERHRQRAALARKQIGDHGHCSRRQDGFADGDAGAQQEQCREALRISGQDGRHAPQHDASGDDLSPVEPIDPVRCGHAGDGIEKGECGAYQQAELGIAQAEILGDGIGEQGWDEAIDQR